MRRHLFLAFFLAISVSLCPASENSDAPRKPRTALVIGNGRYEAEFGRLRNAENDARTMARVLRLLGFSVIERLNVSREQLGDAVEDFRRTLRNSEVAIFYYAGHGIAVSGSNYLVPIKSGFQPEGADATALRLMAETRLFNAEQAVADMNSGGAACNLVILDACRNSPFTAQPATRSLARTSGLSEMTPPAGSLIAFAADAGQVAFDGDGKNGLFTEELLKHLQTPGLTIEQVFKRTRAAVIRRSGGAQVPAEYSRLIGDDVFLAGTQQPSSPTILPAEAAPEPADSVPAATPAPTSAEALLALAQDRETDKCLAALIDISSTQGPGDYAVEPLETLLNHVKDDLRDATTPSPRVVAAESTCGQILDILPTTLGSDHSRLHTLQARAYNRRGSALIILGKPQEALECFNQALPLDREDAYILYNRGRAHQVLGHTEEAKNDFNAAAGPRYKQPGAKQLAIEALAAMK